MVSVIAICFVLVLATTFVHYEALRLLHFGLPALAIPDRLKLVVVILTAFIAHALEIGLYGLAMYGLVVWGSAGGVSGNAGTSLESFLYFSAETYTSLGFGDLTPVGPIRLLVGVEALNGLLLIGWSASFTYLSMERFWRNSP
ncbi:MAG TPA: ion channel [Usitatibacteraceae bacterium]|nr:ion channel [Usitatibacteraceae bacterium]